jgi:hypothetical protein
MLATYAGRVYPQPTAAATPAACVNAAGGCCTELHRQQTVPSNNNTSDGKMSLEEFTYQPWPNGGTPQSLLAVLSLAAMNLKLTCCALSTAMLLSMMKAQIWVLHRATQAANSPPPSPPVP